MILRARVVLPISHPPMENGAVEVEGPRIISVGRWQEAWARGGKSVIDLGDSVLLPGLVNAHCHLDYTAMAGQVGRGRSFTDWIQAIYALKTSWTPDDYVQSWRRGAQMLMRNGVTTVADIETFPTLLPEVLPGIPLRVFSFLEMIGPKDDPPAEEILRRTEMEVRALSHLPGQRGLSPHALFSTTPRLLESSAQSCRQNGWRMTCHVAESQPEYDMFMFGKGSLFDWLKSQRDTSDCGQGSPVQLLDRLGVLGDNLLAVHANYLADADVQLLGRRRVHVVHCPRSHAFFHHRSFPRIPLAHASVNLCLGTDSLASTEAKPPAKPELSLFDEMQALLASSGPLSRETLLQMATINGARALGLSGLIGELIPGAFADLITLPFAGKMAEVSEAVVQHQGPVTASLIGGHWVVNNP